MKISYNWLRDFIKTDLSVDKISEILTDIGLEVEGVEKVGISEEDLENFVVGEVISCEKHPNADKLKVTQINFGNEITQIVCGAPNVATGQKVPVARPGAVIKNGSDSFKIKKAKLRGEESNGMICSKKELRISNESDGIWEMDTSLSPGTPLSDILETNTDSVFEIGLTPNRADAMSHYGVARDLNAALKSRKLNTDFISPIISDLKSSTEKNPISIKVDNSDLCPRYSGVYIRNVKVSESPQWLQNKLQSIGLVPKNNIVDITNYILHHVGQPMHAFDADKINGNQIIISKSKKDIKFNTLDGEQRVLNGEELMIQDGNGENLGMAGVMGGLNSAVSNQTQNIFLESAYFNPVSIRKSSKAHNINSDSSFRFERGIDPNFTVKALNLAANLILEIAGGEIVGEIIDIYPSEIKNFNIVLQYRNVDQLLGERIHREKIKEILNLLEINIISENSTLLELEVPAYRVDVQREADVIEEILRIYGFNSIDGNDKVSFSIVKGEGYDNDKIENLLADLLVSHGYNEAMNLSMYKKNYNDWFGFDDEKSVDIINALSSDLSCMRRTLLPSLLENLEYNIKRKQENLKLFEFGHTYQKTKNGFKENRTIAIVITGNLKENHWDLKDKNVDIFYLKGIVNQLLRKLKVDDIQWDINDKVFAKEEITGSIKNKEIVVIGQLKNSILKKFDLSKPVYYAEIQISNLISYYLQNRGVKFKELSKYPFVKRDLALLIDENITYQSIKDTVKSIDDKRLKNIDLFDVYEGDKLPKGKKSYAISIILQDEEKTMNDNQIDEIMNKVIKTLKKELNAELR